jgi:uncharacterized protein YukE
MYSVKIRATKDEVQDASKSIVQAIEEVIAAFDKLTGSIERVDADIDSLIADVDSARSNPAQEDIQSLARRLQQAKETRESSAREFADELAVKLPRLSATWQRFADAFLSHYSGATLEGADEREAAIEVRSVLYDIQEGVNRVLVTAQKHRVTDEQRDDDAEVSDPVRDAYAWVWERLSEEFTLILSYIIRMINILDVRLRNSGDPARAR